MGKIIKMTDPLIEQCMAEFAETLKSGRLMDGKISYSKVFSVVDRKAKVYFTPEAWVKMELLVQEFNKEVAWHGVASRFPKEQDAYIITDILVYPQTVTSTTVEMDEEEYTKWLMENDEDDRFWNIHMQGHSHVKMGVTPSGTDLTHQEEILGQLKDDGFYIFMIWNKSLEHNVKVYDLEENILFENGDVNIGIYSETGVDFDGFLKEAKDMVKDPPKTYKPAPYISPYTSPYTGGYYGGSFVRESEAECRDQFENFGKSWRMPGKDGK